MTIVYDDVFLLHGHEGHPERPARLASITARLRSDERLTAVPWTDGGATDGDDSLLTMVHSERHIRAIEATSASVRGYAMVDVDTYCTRESYRVATRAAAATTWAAHFIAAGGGEHAFALVRPPGHHATPDKAMGFCLFNNAAVAVRTLQQHADVRRVAVIDIDVHHGNGTQEAFYGDPSVLYASLHQYPYYPGSGAVEEIGRGAGEGMTLNVPLPGGTAGATWLRAFGDHVEPAVDGFHPDAIVVSAGYDGHEADPLADFLLSTADYATIGRRIRVLARANNAPTLWVLEGGYNLKATADSVAETVYALLDGAG